MMVLDSPAKRARGISNSHMAPIVYQIMARNPMPERCRYGAAGYFAA